MYVIVNDLGVATNGLIVLLYTWGIYHSVKNYASNFVMII